MRIALISDIHGNLAALEAELGAEELAALSSSVPKLESELEGTPLVCVHASLDSDEEFLWPDSPAGEFRSLLGAGGIRAFGHIHHQFARTIGTTLYLNPGSVGFPFDGERCASCALLALTKQERRADLVRVAYDLELTLEALASRRVPWLGRIRAALEQSRSFFAPELDLETEQPRERAP